MFSYIVGVTVNVFVLAFHKTKLGSTASATPNK